MSVGIVDGGTCGFGVLNIPLDKGLQIMRELTQENFDKFCDKENEGKKYELNDFELIYDSHGMCSIYFKSYIVGYRHPYGKEEPIFNEWYHCLLSEFIRQLTGIC